MKIEATKSNRWMCFSCVNLFDVVSLVSQRACYLPLLSIDIDVVGCMFFTISK